MKVHLTSLGCPKNRVDAEHMLGIARSQGHELVGNSADADALVINTCAFINDAKEESIEAILEAVAQKKGAAGQKKVIVSGCLAQRYAKELMAEIPEVDYFLGTSDFSAIGGVLDSGPMLEKNGPGLVGLGHRLNKNLVSSDLTFIEKFDLPRVNTSPSFSAYLRISEGCDNKCAFCIIPKLRGKQRSKSVEQLVKEASALAKTGVMELNLIGQDLTAYGFDLPGRPTLATLLGELANVSGIKWIRQLYAYPRSFSQSYFDAFKHENVLPYIDMPLQHASAKILRAMRRGSGSERLLAIVKSLKDNVPSLVFRTTVIVGFPGETQADFDELCRFVEESQFDRMGVFKYSNEENTEAYNFSCQVSDRLKEERFATLMGIQQNISHQKLAKLKGTTQVAVVEGASDEHEYLVKGRLWSQAPDIDGSAYIASVNPLKVGDMVTLLITDTHDYDVSGEVVDLRNN